MKGRISSYSRGPNLSQSSKEPIKDGELGEKQKQIATEFRMRTKSLSSSEEKGEKSSCVNSFNVW